jgi:uncharacterized protein HemX
VYSSTYEKTHKETAMYRLMSATLTVLFALSIGNYAFAQQHMPRGTATDVTNDEIQATEPMASRPPMALSTAKSPRSIT